MNYGEQLKEKETKLLNLKATIMAKKQSLTEALEAKKKVEVEVKEKFNIELSELPELKLNLEKELKELSEKLTVDIESIENELNSIK